MKKGLQPQYSGKRSRKFWNKVNACKGKKRELLYFCGVMLQDFEGRVLQWLQEK